MLRTTGLGEREKDRCRCTNPVSGTVQDSRGLLDTLYLYACLCAHGSTSVFTFICQRTTLGAIPQGSTAFFQTGSLTGLEFACNPQRSTCLCFLHARFKSVCHKACFSSFCFFKMWVPSIRPRSLCLKGKHRAH